MKDTFDTLKGIVQVYSEHLAIVHDKLDHFYLNTKSTDGKDKGEFFAAVRIKKNYVAFHLMPIYYYPELIDDISPDLRKKMQGKSCFNFKSINSSLIKELVGLSESSFQTYVSEKRISTNET